MCTAPAIQGVSALAAEANDAMLWPIVGVACVCAGALLGAMELAMGTAMLGADQRFLKIAKRRASRSSRGGGGESPPKEERNVSFTLSADSHAFGGSRPGSYTADRSAYYQMLPPGSVAPQKTASGAFVVHARA